MKQIAYASPEDLAVFQGKRCYAAIMEQFIDTISNERWQDCINTFFTMPTPSTAYSYDLLSNWDFYVSPGSGAHHTHFGGLALHTLQNLEYAKALAKSYEIRGIFIDYDLLYTTIALHDTMKRFIYRFDENYNFQKAEDPFIAKKEDHHSWVLREMTKRGCDRELILSVAAMHGIDDVALATGVKSVGIVNHYLAIGQTGLNYTPEDIRPEHVIAFLADTDWHWSGQAQVKTGLLAEKIAVGNAKTTNYLKLYLGSRFTYEHIGRFIEMNGYPAAVTHFSTLL